ncbi:MAG: gephyrin-like molybdotransferase Glp [Thermoproteota archaeon]
MKRRFSYISVEEAFQAISDAINVGPMDSETLPVPTVYHRVLAENVVSPTNIPPHDMSHFDGFAIKSMDTNGAFLEKPVFFEVIGKKYPGQDIECEVNHDEACYVTTGSLLPKGADSVVAVEATKKVGEGRIKVQTEVDPYEHVFRCGSDIEKGQIVLSKGHELRSQDIILLATLGVERVEVVKKPRVAIFCVGDELTDQPEEVKQGKVFNSLRYFLSAATEECGGTPVYMGIVPDNITKIEKKLEEALTRADMLLLVGGSSMGKKDFTAEAVDSVGRPGMIVHGIKRKPGRVSGFGVVKDKPVVLLPGLSHFMVVGFHAFVFPLISVMAGLSISDSRLTLKAELTETITFETFLSFEQVTFVRLKRKRGEYLAEPCFGGSNSFRVLVNANALLITPPRETTVKAGEEVEVNLLPGFFSLKDILTTL